MAPALRVLLLGLAEPLRHHLEQLPRDLGVRLDERPELPRGEAVADDFGLGGHGRRAQRLFVDQRDLAEVVARADLTAGLAVDVDAGRSLADDEEADAARSFRRDRVAGRETARLEGARDALEVLVGEALEERNLLEQLDRRFGHAAILCRKRGNAKGLLLGSLDAARELLDLPLRRVEPREAELVELLAALPEADRLVEL